MTEAETQAYRFDDDGRFPNSPLPLVVYHQVIPRGEASPEAFEALLAENGWPPRWRYTVYGFHHYHSTSHEALGVARGSADILFGGPGGETVSVTMGDAVTIPAGVAHCLIAGSADFLVVGVYPPEMDADLLRGEDGERPDADARIAALPLPRTDPFTGETEGIVRRWR